MSGQILDRILTSYRIGDPAGLYPIYDSTGSKLWPGRWNNATAPLIYSSEHYSTAMLEKLVHGNGHIPVNQHFIEIQIPPGVTYEVFSPAHHPGWDAENCLVSKAFGAAWQASGRSLILIVPSLMARMEMNILINDSHNEADKITHGLHQPIWWDKRLFSGSAPAPTTAGASKKGGKKS